jgi:hypothetical protein
MDIPIRYGLTIKSLHLVKRFARKRHFQACRGKEKSLGDLLHIAFQGPGKLEGNVDRIYSYSLLGLAMHLAGGFRFSSFLPSYFLSILVLSHASRT